MAKRIQLRRTKGWRKSEGAVVVARPTKWGNPYRVGVDYYGTLATPEIAVNAFRMMVLSEPVTVAEIRRELRGKDLACWCPLDQPCHADVLLELANSPPELTNDR